MSPSSRPLTLSRLLMSRSWSTSPHDAPNEQSWLDPLPMWLLKECSDLLSSFLSALWNMSLGTGVVPASFKTAVVTPLINKSSMDVNSLHSYRPISNLSFVSKLLERLVSTQLQSHVVTHSLLPSNQSAYRRGHSTETALLKVYCDLI